MNPISKLYAALFLPLDLGLVSFYFFFIALRILIQRRPLVLSSRWTIALIAVAFAPSVLNSFVFNGLSKGMNIMFWINPLMFGTLFFFLMITIKGYVVYGATEEYIREALLSTVATLGYTAEETMSCLKIKETGQEIKVMIQGAVGSAQLRPKSKDSALLVKQIAQGMTSYFQNHAGETKMLIAYFYLLIGVFLLATVISLARLMSHLH